MSSNSRKQITYAQKRNRSKPLRIVSASSPLHELDDAMPRAQSPTRPLKRARRSSNPEFFFPSKLESSLVTPAASPSHFETPYPSALTEEQTFKLMSSRGLPMHPDQFSPLPAAHPRTTSSNMYKENVVVSRRVLKKDASLDSPFNSRPNSARSSPQKRSLASTHKLFKRTLSDTNYNPNIPQSTSTTSSPSHSHSHSPTRLRRPSAPSPPRPGTWIPKETTFGDFDFDFHSAHANPFFLPSAVNDIDFNRPPSSLSFYGDADSPLFDDPQAVSTPQRAYILGSAVEDEDEDFGDEETDLTITQDPMGVDSSYGMRVPSEWKHRDEAGAYMHSPSEDFDMYDDISLGLGLRLAPLVPNVDDDDDGGGGGAADPALRTEGSKTREGELRQMFDGLALAPRNRFLTTRTRSLDSPSSVAVGADAAPSRPKGRDRRGTIRASDFPKATFAPARRTRSGTVIGPPAPVARADVDTERIGEVSEDELESWCSDGWAVAAPPSPVVSRRLRWPAAQTHSPGRMELTPGAGLLPSPVLQRKARKGKECAVVQEDVDEEDEDELLLKPGFNVWD
ncbi:hypothetical protein DFH09DRAFT_1271484 [Mycena vulgaris]|nr:hypothetical protein DFH09DRAFT_1271484 [Mycena vulgaris]